MNHKCINCIHCNTTDKYCYVDGHFTQDESVNPPGERATGWGNKCSYFQKEVNLEKQFYESKRKLVQPKQTSVKETSNNHRRLECL